MKYFLSIVILTFSLSLWSHEGGHHEKEQTWKIGNQDPKNIKGISIYSNNGKEVFHSHHFEQAIDLSLQPKGIYFLVIKTSKGEFKQKLILQ